MSGRPTISAPSGGASRTRISPAPGGAPPTPSATNRPRPDPVIFPRGLSATRSGEPESEHVCPQSPAHPFRPPRRRRPAGLPGHGGRRRGGRRDHRRGGHHRQGRRRRGRRGHPGRGQEGREEEAGRLGSVDKVTYPEAHGSDKNEADVAVRGLVVSGGQSAAMLEL